MHLLKLSLIVVVLFVLLLLLGDGGMIKGGVTERSDVKDHSYTMRTHTLTKGTREK